MAKKNKIKKIEAVRDAAVKALCQIALVLIEQEKSKKNILG